MRPSNILGIVFLVCIIASGCSSLHVYQESLSPQDFASFYVLAPDPSRDQFSLGERLLVTWNLDPLWQEAQQTPIVLVLEQLFRNQSREKNVIPIEKRRGHYTEVITGESFLATKGWLSYKVSIQSEHAVWKVWEHQLWVDPLNIDP